MSISYKPVFEQALRESIEHPDYYRYFPTFRSHPELFHFIMAGQGHLAPDRVSLESARALDMNFYGHLIVKGASRLGGGPDTIDSVESRHVLMMTYLKVKLGKDWGHVVEIGGGYGNCLRLIAGHINYESWTIIDYPYILELQEWFLGMAGVDLTNVRFVSKDNIEAQSELTPTVVIGTHSLSEFDFDDFVQYFELIKRSSWLFYVSHTSQPSPDLLEKKRELIQTHFKLFSEMNYEGGASVMRLYKT